MNATTVAVDLAKNVFELAVADATWRVIERCRLTRAQFERWFSNRQVGLVVMEACGSAHHWGRWLRAKGIAVKLLPARYVRPYVRRSKTDAADLCGRPTHLTRGLDLVADDLARETPVNALVDEYFHEAAATRRSFACSRNSMTCSRVTEGKPARNSSMESPASR